MEFLEAVCQETGTKSKYIFHNVTREVVEDDLKVSGLRDVDTLCQHFPKEDDSRRNHLINMFCSSF